MPAYTLELVDWIETLAAKSNLPRRMEGAKISAPATFLSFSPRFVSDVFAQLDSRLRLSVKKLVESKGAWQKIGKCLEIKSKLSLNFLVKHQALKDTLRDAILRDTRQKPFIDPREDLSSCAKRIIAVAVVCIGSLSETHLDRRRKSERRRKRRMKRGRGEREEAK